MIFRTGAVLALFLLISPVRAQLNAYKYIVVPKQFETFNRPNQYQTSTMVKYFLTQKGLPTAWNDARPPELAAEPCQGLIAHLVDESNMLVTKVRIRLMDCADAVVYETGEGRSKLKEYKDAYREAIEEAMKSLNGVNYAYEPPAPAVQPTASTSPATGSAGPGAQPVTVAEKATALPAAQPVAEQGTSVVSTAAEEPESATPPRPEAAREPASPSPTEVTQAQQPAMPVPLRSEPDTAEPPSQTAASTAQTSGPNAQTGEPELLYAQETENGYQLVDSTPSVRMQLHKTSRPDTYIALVDGQPMGSVFKEGDGWIHEYYREGALVRQALRIRFY